MVVGEKTLNASLHFRFDGASYTSTLVSSFRLPPTYAAVHAVKVFDERGKGRPLA
jgi:hypothetical protein